MFQVDIIAEATVKFSKIVVMPKEDYEAYLKIIESGKSNSQIDKEIQTLAEKYNFYGSGEDIMDIGLPQDIEFNIINNE